MRVLENRIQFTTDLVSIFKSKEDMLFQLAGQNVLKWLSSIASQVSSLDFAEIHKANFQLFFDVHLKDLVTTEKILNIVGSYGFFNQVLLKEVLIENQWEIGSVLEQPINNLVEYHLGLND